MFRFLLVLVCLLVPEVVSTETEIIFPPRRFEFKIDPQTPIADLLPPAPDVAVPLSPWLVREWTIHSGRDQPGANPGCAASLTDYYDPSASPDLLVRADVTYLRQDFSFFLRVKDAAPWPEMQRFDYLVRTRPVSSAEAAAYQRWLKEQGPGYLAPHRRAALAALRTLTGRDASEPTAKAWRAVLEK